MIPVEKVQPPNIQNSPVFVLAGPTAIGKTELALTLAEEFNGEIIGMDSMQIYKHLDIGTAKPTKDERARVPHHLVDYVDPAEEYSAARFIKDCAKAVEQIRSRGRIPMMVGGTGLYMKTFFEGVCELPKIDQQIRQQLLEEIDRKGTSVLYAELLECDPVSADRIHTNDTSRLVRALEIFRGTGIPWSSFIDQHRLAKEKAKSEGTMPLKICLKRDRNELYERINQRVDIMIDQGLLQEVENLLAMGYEPGLNSMQSLGYRHMINFIQKNWSWQQTKELLARDTRRYAKRQLTWFTRDQEMVWYRPDQQNEIFTKVTRYLESTS